MPIYGGRRRTAWASAADVACGVGAAHQASSASCGAAATTMARGRALPACLVAAARTEAVADTTAAPTNHERAVEQA